MSWKMKKRKKRKERKKGNKVTSGLGEGMCSLCDGEVLMAFECNLNSHQ